MTCSRCGAEIGAGNTFCARCGTPVAASASGATPGPAAQPYGPPGTPPPGPPPPGGPQQGPPVPYAAPAGWPVGVPYGPPVPRPAGASRNLKIIAGIMAIVGAVIVLVGSALPYAHLATGVGGKYASESIFDAGSGASLNNLFFAAEPIVVVLVAIVGGILLLVTRRDMLVTIVAAMLTALGTQTFFLFVGYAFGLDFGTNKMGVGGGVGMLAGFVLAAAGIIGLIGEAGYFRRQSAM